MKNLTLLKLALVLYVAMDFLGGASVGFLPFTPIAAAQTALTQTTLSSAVSGASVYSGNGTSSIDTQVTLASVTNVVGASTSSNQFGSLYTSSQGGQFASMLFVDAELMGVLSVNTTTKVVQVVRGIEGTMATDHASATMVLLGPSGAFQKYDPRGSCTAAATLFTPWVNVISGKQWLCSTVTKTWVPGFGNPGDSIAPPAVTAAVASAAGSIVPSGPLFHITGTLAITGFTIPVGFNGTAVGGGCFTAIPDGAFTYTTAGNIGLASTGLNAGTAVVVANQPITFCWDGTNSKWLPNTQ